MSLLETSYLSPTDANDDTPMPSLDRCSSTAMPIPPDWTIRPAVPGGGLAPANVAFRPMPGTAMPKQFGPTRRMPNLRQVARSSAPVSATMPAEMTTSDLAPARPQSCAAATTLAAGTAITARSGGCGRPAADGTLGTPATEVAFGLIANTWPLNPAASMLRKIA